MRSSEIGFLYAGVSFDGVGSAFSNDGALRHDTDFFGQRENDVHIVFDDDFGDFAVAQSLQKVDGAVGVCARHTRGGFVQQQQLGLRKRSKKVVELHQQRL